MPLTFDVPQKAHVGSLHAQGVAAPATPGAFIPMCGYAENVLMPGNPPPTVDLEIKKSQRWFSGATQANSRIGPQAIRIQEDMRNHRPPHRASAAPTGSARGGPPSVTSGTSAAAAAVGAMGRGRKAVIGTSLSRDRLQRWTANNPVLARAGAMEPRKRS